MGNIGIVKDKNGFTVVNMYESNASSRSHAFRVHNHTDLELSLILSGKGIYSCDKREFNIKEGDVYYFKNSESHCITDIDEGGMNLLNIHISPQYLRNLKSRFDNDMQFGIEFLQISFPSNRLNDFMKDSDLTAISQTFLKIREEFQNGYQNSVHLIETYVNFMLIIMSRQVQMGKELNPNLPGGTTDLIFRSAEYIDEHYTEDISLEQIANSVNLEKTYFSAQFKKIIGLSPWKYICIKRTEQAINLLRQTDKNILDIAMLCGFNNTANFNKIFKKYTGALPKNIRNKQHLHSNN